MSDLEGVEVGETKESLASDGRESGFRDRLGLAAELERIEGPEIHELEENGDVTGWGGEDAVAAHDRGVIGGAPQDLDLSGGVAAGLRIAGVEDFEGVDGGGGAVAYLVDNAAIAMAKDFELIEV